MISHSTFEDQPQEMLDAQRLSARTATEITLRSRAEITRFFGDLTIVEPGVVHMPLWRPDRPSDGWTSTRSGSAPSAASPGSD